MDTLKVLTILIVIAKNVHALPTNTPDIYSLTNCTKEQLVQVPNVAAITELNVDFCNITELENAFFVRYTSLSILEITDSKLTTLEDYSLHGLKHLKTLSLARNNITEVKSWSNEQMVSLISLDLRRNAIRALTLKSFQRYPNLQRLILVANLLDDIDDGIFRWMPHLKYLNLGRNRLKTIDARNFHGMHRLTHLALHYNEIEDIEGESFQTNVHLRSLRLEGNNLVDLEFMTVKNLVRLVHLNLSYNAIDSLERLSFSKDYELIDLDFSHNRLTQVLVDTFAGLMSLECLNISHNTIQHIEPRSFHELTSLRHIDLSANNLTQLPADIFNGTTQLERINISHNAVQEIDATLFAGMPQLIMLDLSSNQLHTDAFIENLASELNRVAFTLDLSDNHFNMLNMSVLMDFERVQLAGNWWSCKWLIQEMLRIPQTIHFGRSYAVVATWSSALLDVTGIDCYDGPSKRTIVVLDTAKAWQRYRMGDEYDPTDSPNPSPPPLIWPKIRLDKFDSRSVIIWMLIAIAIAFAALRIGRKFIDRNERMKQAKRLKEKESHLSVVLLEENKLNSEDNLTHEAASDSDDSGDMELEMQSVKGKQQSVCTK